jgi:hypothetical protein
MPPQFVAWATVDAIDWRALGVGFVVTRTPMYGSSFAGHRENAGT